MLVLHSGNSLADNAGPWGGPIKPPTAMTTPTALPRILEPAAIKKIFGTGYPFLSISESQQTFEMVFNKDGIAQSRERGQKNKTRGTWRLSKIGYCTRWGKNAERCFTVRKAGAFYEVRSSSGKIVAYWQKL